MEEKMPTFVWIVLGCALCIGALIISFRFGTYHGSDCLRPVGDVGVTYVACEYVPAGGHVRESGTRNCHAVEKVRLVHSGAAHPVYRLRDQ